MKIFVILPTYNEKPNIRKMIDKILSLEANLGIIVIDDNSPDGTADTVEEFYAENPAVILKKRSEKSGLGTAYIAGFKEALSRNADYIITMDSDFSHDPDRIPEFIKLSKTNHLVIGSRYIPGGEIWNWGFYRKALSYTANFITNNIIHIRANDATSGFRCYQRDILINSKFDTIKSNGYSYLVEILYKIQETGSRICEIPICFKDRIAGKSKISKLEILKAIWTVLRLLIHRLLQTK